MTSKIVWKAQAVRQFRALSPAHQHDARALVQKIAANPDAGWHAGTTIHEGRQVDVRTFPGYTVEIEFYRWGRFRRRLTIFIHAVRPMDWPSIDMD